MTNSGAWVPGYVLHLWPYRETSAIAEILTAGQGRVGAVVRGLKKKRPNQSLQPFQRYVFAWRGQRELVNLSAWEPDARALHLQGTALVSAMYVANFGQANRKADPHEGLFEAYQVVLEQLSGAGPKRHSGFSTLLASLGYGLDIDSRIEPGSVYTFSLEQGIELAQAETLDDPTRVSGGPLGVAAHDLNGKDNFAKLNT